MVAWAESRDLGTVALLGSVSGELVNVAHLACYQSRSCIVSPTASFSEKPSSNLLAAKDATSDEL